MFCMLILSVIAGHISIMGKRKGIAKKQGKKESVQSVGESAGIEEKEKDNNVKKGEIEYSRETWVLESESYSLDSLSAKEDRWGEASYERVLTCREAWVSSSESESSGIFRAYKPR